MTGRQGNKRKYTAKDDLVPADGSPEDTKSSGLKNTLHGNGDLNRWDRKVN